MAGNDPVDQDAIAAQWEASLDSEDPAEAAQTAAANELEAGTASSFISASPKLASSRNFSFPLTSKSPVLGYGSRSRNS